MVIERVTASSVAQREWATQHGTTPHCIDQARLYPPARELLDRRKNNGDGGMEALRILKRRLSDVVYRAMLADQTAPGRRLTEEQESDPESRWWGCALMP